MKTFRYCLNHKADEAYMEKMCRAGWAAAALVEGVWTFEPCKPGQYTYRVAYLRGKSGAQVEQLKAELAGRGIEFVSRYSFWAIFRSEKDFALYAPEEELALCERIRRPMFGGSIISWIAFALCLLLAAKISPWFSVLCALLGVYGGVCTCLLISYSRLIGRLKRAKGQQRSRV